MTHLLLGVEHSIVHIYIKHHSSVTHLLTGDCESLVVGTLFYQAQELSASRHIASFAHIYKAVARKEAIQTRQPGELALLLWAWLILRHRLGNGAYMVGCRAAAASHNIYQPQLGKVSHVACHNLWCLVVATHLVGDACIWIGTHIARCRRGYLLQEWQHLLCSKRAV